MTFVVDASVAIKWFIREEDHDRAMRLARRRDELLAPDLIIAEVTNIAWKKHLRGEISEMHARDIARIMKRAIPWPRLYSSSSLNEEALRIAIDLRHPVYDCIYLACADMTDSILVTADRRLLAAAAGTPYAAHVRLLGDPDLSVPA